MSVDGDWRSCECCGRKFPDRKSYQSTICSTCKPMAESGMRFEDICEELIYRTKDFCKIKRLREQADTHRDRREKYVAANLGSKDIDDQLRKLRQGYKEITRPIVYDCGRSYVPKNYRCPRCGYCLNSRKCLKCELEIEKGEKA